MRVFPPSTTYSTSRSKAPSRVAWGHAWVAGRWRSVTPIVGPLEEPCQASARRARLDKVRVDSGLLGRRVPAGDGCPFPREPNRHSHGNQTGGVLGPRFGFLSLREQ